MKEESDVKSVTGSQNGARETSPSPLIKKPSNLAFIMTLVSLALAVFCVALDTVIVVTAIPRITDDFHSVNDIGWSVLIPLPLSLPNPD